MIYFHVNVWVELDAMVHFWWDFLEDFVCLSWASGNTISAHVHESKMTPVFNCLFFFFLMDDLRMLFEKVELHFFA